MSTNTDTTGEENTPEAPADAPEKFTSYPALLPADGRWEVVLVTSAPDQDGTVHVLNASRGGTPSRAAAADLQPIPELPPTPEGTLTDWWTVTDAHGTELTRVAAADGPGARKAAMREAGVRTVVARDKGLAVRRLYSSELDVPTGELTGLPRIALPPAPVVKVKSGFTRKSIPTRLRESGAPGRMVSLAAGLRWLLPTGEELTPGEAATRFLND